MARPYKAVPAKLADGTRKTYYYHRATNRRIDSEPGAPDWEAKLAAAGRSDKDAKPGTVGWLIQRYLKHEDYRDLSPHTQRVYERGFDALKPILAGKASDVKPRHIVAIYDSLLPKRGMANQFLTAASVLFRFGVRVGSCEFNPATDIQKKAGGHLREWDEVWIAQFVARWDKADSVIRLAFLLARHTGMREADVCRMTWAWYDGRCINYLPQKTGKKSGVTLTVPVTQDLKAALDEAKREATSIFVVPGTAGGKMTEGALRKRWGRTLAAMQMEARPFHGSRKAAVIALAEAGATPHEISSWTGHSLQMITLYTKGVNQTRLAENAFAKLTARTNQG